MSLQEIPKIWKKAHCLFQRKVNIWSYGRGTVTAVQYGSEGKERSTEKVRYSSVIATTARHLPAGKETKMVYI